MSICVLVCGSRFTQNIHNGISRTYIKNILALLKNVHNFTDIEIVEGGADGVDTIAKEVSIELGYKVTEFKVTKADWSRYGKGAGPMRNKKMLDYLVSRRDDNPELVLALIAFHSDLSKSRGTLNMINQVRNFNGDGGISMTILKESP